MNSGQVLNQGQTNSHHMMGISMEEESLVSIHAGSGMIRGRTSIESVTQPNTVPATSKKEISSGVCFFRKFYTATSVD